MSKKVREVVEGDILLCVEEIKSPHGEAMVEAGSLARVRSVQSETEKRGRIVEIILLNAQGNETGLTTWVTPDGWLKSFKILTARHTPTMRMDVNLHVLLPPQHIDIEIDFGEFFSTSDPYKELKEAHADGKTIEVKVGSIWLVVSMPSFLDPVANYRIQPDHADWKIDDVINCAYEENAVGIIAHYAGENADGKPSVFVDGLSSKTSDRLQETGSTAHYKFMRKVS